MILKNPFLEEDVKYSLYMKQSHWHDLGYFSLIL